MTKDSNKFKDSPDFNNSANKPTRPTLPKVFSIFSHSAFLSLLILSLFLTGCNKGGSGQGSDRAGSKSENSESLGGEKMGSDSEKDLTLEKLKQTPALERGEWLKGADGKQYYKNSVTFFDSFDTVIRITMYAADEAEFKRFSDLAHVEFNRLHRLYDNYNAYEGVNNIYALNKEGHDKAISLDADLFNLLKFSKDNYHKALGKVNIAMGSVLSLWHDEREKAGVTADNADNKLTDPKDIQGREPDKALLEEAGKHMNIDDLVLNEADKTAMIKDPQMLIDAGAVAKGYAAELVARKLEEAGLKAGILSAGGNVRVVGLPPDGRSEWKIGLSHPRATDGGIIGALAAGQNASVVTSGDYQRFYYVGDKRYHHIIDPKTLYPGGSYCSVTVETGDSGLADFLSTAFFLSNDEEAMQIAQNFSEVTIGLVRIDPDLNISISENIEDKFELNK